MLWLLVLVLCGMLLAHGDIPRFELTVDKAWSIRSEWTVLGGPVPDPKAKHEIEGTEYSVEYNGSAMFAIERPLWPYCYLLL